MEMKSFAIILVVVLLIAGCFVHKNDVLICPSKYSYCKVQSNNIYNMGSSKNIIVANEVGGVFYHINYKEGYAEFLFMKKAGDSISLPAKIYKDDMDATKKNNELMACFLKEKYPCKINLD